jgi:hypothetical protein
MSDAEAHSHVLVVALAGAANAAGWRSLRVDGSSNTSFAKSVAEFEQKLSPARHHVFVLALHDIWNKGTKTAEANQREYTADEYVRQLDGLGYEEVVTLTDPTGDTAEARYRGASHYYALTAPRTTFRASSRSRAVVELIAVNYMSHCAFALAELVRCRKQSLVLRGGPFATAAPT